VLRASASALGVHQVWHLGYADSGHGPILLPDPPGHTQATRGHGRPEKRTIRAVTVDAGLVFPHAQAIQVVRGRQPGRKKKWSAETCYAVTSLTVTQAGPAELAAIIRGHWGIEDRLHWVRSRHGLRRRPLPDPHRQRPTHRGQSTGNLAISILRLAGATSIAAALRHNTRRTGRPLQAIMKC